MVAGERRGPRAGSPRGVPGAQPLLNQAQVDARFQQMGGPTMPQRVHGSALVEAAFFERGAKSLLHTALGHRLGGLGQVNVVTTFGGKKQYLVAMHLPILAQQLERPLR